MNYSTVFLIFLCFGSGIYALWVLRRAYATYALDYLRFFAFRLAADLTITVVWSALYLAGTPLYSIDCWNQGNGLLALLYAVGVACVFTATDSQVATAFSLSGIHRRRQFTFAYVLLLFGIAATAGVMALIGSLAVSLLADRAMLVFAVISRSLGVCASAVLLVRYRNRDSKAASRAIVCAGCFFLLIDGSWLALYALGMMGMLPARLYDGLHLTRMLLINAIVAVYLARFLDLFEGTRTPLISTRQLDPHLLRKYGISKREAEIIQHLRLGRSNEEIAEKLFISIRTVKGHLYRIFQKTSVKNRVQLVNLFGNRGQDSE